MSTSVVQVNNIVSVTNPETKVVTTNTPSSNIVVQDAQTQVVTVNSPGTIGPQGPQGPPGPSGSNVTPEGTISSSAQIVEFGFALTGSNVIFNTITASGDISSSGDLHATSMYLNNSGSVLLEFDSSTSDSIIRFRDNSLGLHQLKWDIGRDNTNQNFVFSNDVGLQTTDLLILTPTGDDRVIINGALSSSGYVSASSFIGDGSQLTGVASFPFTGSAKITGSLIVTGSSILSGSVVLNDLTYPTTNGEDGEVLATDGLGNVFFGHPEKLHLQARNDNGVDIPAGTPVYSTGEIGGSNRIKVRIASASDASTMPAIGITETTLTTTGGTQDGFVIINGVYNNNITPIGSSPSLGDTVYIHANGGLTVDKPTNSDLIQNIGTILKTNGTIIQGMKVSSIDRTNDVPNLHHNNIFYGSGSDQSYQTHISGALDSTIINNITASGNISSSGYISASNFIGDGSGLTNIPAPINNDVDVYLNFESATSYAYIVPYDLQFAGFTTSSVFTAQFSSSGAPYVFGTTLNQFDTLAITSSAAGLITLSGSKI